MIGAMHVAWRYKFADEGGHLGSLLTCSKPMAAEDVIDLLCERYSLREGDLAMMADPPFDVWPDCQLQPGNCG